VIATTLDPRELERQLAEVDAQISAHKGIDGLLEELASLKADADVLAQRVSRLDYNNSGASIRGLEAILEQLEALRRSGPDSLNERRVGLDRLEYAIAGNFKALRVANAEIDGLEHFLNRTATLKASHLTREIEGLRKEKSKAEKQLETVRRGIEKIENLIMKERENETEWTPNA
jgi:chromosome segregation ATPase